MYQHTSLSILLVSGFYPPSHQENRLNAQAVKDCIKAKKNKGYVNEASAIESVSKVMTLLNPRGKHESSNMDI